MPAAPGTKPIKPLHKGMGLYQVLYWPQEAKKAGYPDKPYAVVNLRTRDVNGRWFATKEAALAQARALYAKLGDKAKVQTEEGNPRNAFFFSATPEALLDGTDGPKWVEAIMPKTYSVPAYGDVVITPEKIDNFISNLNDNVRGQDIAIDYEHGLDPSKGKKAAGWIRGARKNNDGKLELAIDFTEPAKQEIINKEWKYFSLEWDDAWQHPDGVFFNDVVMGGALTNRPVAKGLMPINFSEIFSEMAALERSDPGLNQPIYDPSDPQPDPGTAHFVPRETGDPAQDPAIGGGWRRNTPPIAEDVFTFTEEQATTYLQASATALSEYAEEEPTADDVVMARGLVSSISNLMDQDSKKYSEYTDLSLKVKKFFEKKKLEDDSNSNVRVEFTEQEAIGYLTSAKTGLVRVHTNAANGLIDDIDKMLAQDYRKRSFNELQTLVSKTRNMLRGEDDDTSTTKTTTTPLKGGTTVGELTEKDLRELRNVLDVDDDGKILEAVQHKFGELHLLRDAVSASEQERVFAEQYPQFYEQHQQLMERDRRNTAKTFAESVGPVRQASGLGLKTTKMGLSTKALEVLTEAHVKFSEGKGTLEDFETVIKNIMHGGIVQFGEIGSSGDDALPEIDTTTPQGVASGRKLFAEVVAKVQRENPDMDIITAYAEAARKHPDLADNYSVTLPA